jgi:hypothetical protein
MIDSSLVQRGQMGNNTLFSARFRQSSTGQPHPYFIAQSIHSMKDRLVLPVIDRTGKSREPLVREE